MKKITLYITFFIVIVPFCKSFGQKWKENTKTYQIVGVTESNFIKPDRETDFVSNYLIIKNSNFSDLNRAGAKLEENVKNKYNIDLLDFFNFELIPKPSKEFTVDSDFTQLDFEIILTKIYKKNILYAFDSEDYFNSFIKNISTKLFQLVQNSSNLKSHRIVVEIPYKLNSKKKKKRKKIIPAEFDIEILCYFAKDGSKRIRFYNLYPLLRNISSTYMFIALNGYSKKNYGNAHGGYKYDIVKSFIKLSSTESIIELIENKNNINVVSYFLSHYDLKSVWKQGD